MKLDELEKLADSATHGPWHSPGIGEIHVKHPDHPEGCIEIASVIFPNEYNDEEGGKQEDADFIAACDPHTIKRLIALVRLQHDALDYLQNAPEGVYSELQETKLAMKALAAYGAFENGLA